MKKILLAAAVMLTALTATQAQETSRTEHVTVRHQRQSTTRNNSGNGYNNNAANNRSSDHNTSANRNGYNNNSTTHRSERDVNVTRTAYGDHNGYSHRTYHKRVRRVHHVDPQTNY